MNHPKVNDSAEQCFTLWKRWCNRNGSYVS